MGTRSLKDSDIQVGNKYSSNNFGDFVVIEVKSSKEVYIKFDNTGGVNKVWSIQIRKGEVKDKFAPTVHGFGFIGNESIKGDAVTKKASDLWRSMILRCYGNPEKNPSYKDKVICEEWRSFRTFKLWFIKKVEDGHYREGWHLDKDLLFKGNKVYSPATCVFIPKEINLAISSEKNGKQFGCYPFKGKFQSRCSNVDGVIECFTGTELDCIGWYMHKKKGCLLAKAERFKGDLDPKAYLALIEYAYSLVQTNR